MYVARKCKYIVGLIFCACIFRLRKWLNFEQGSGDTSMIDTLHQADTFKVVLKEPEILAESPPVEEDVCYSEKHHIREHFTLLFFFFFFLTKIFKIFFKIYRIIDFSRLFQNYLSESFFFLCFLEFYRNNYQTLNIFLIYFIKWVYNWNLTNDFKICFVAVVSDYDEDNDKDIRWYPIHEDLELPKTEAERQEELRKLTKPFLHDLHTWYSKNKPTKLFTPVRQIGKKAMPERRFSHL